MLPDTTLNQVKPKDMVPAPDERFKHPIICQDWTTGKTTGKGIDQIWADVHRVREEKTMSGKPKLDIDNFIARAKSGYTIGQLAKAFGVSWHTAKNYTKKYCTEGSVAAHDGQTIGEPGEGVQDPLSNLPPVRFIEITPSPMMLAAITEAAQTEPATIEDVTLTDVLLHEAAQAELVGISEPLIVSQPAADEPDTECPVAVADSNVGNMEEPKEISVQVAIEWREELEEDMANIMRLIDPNGPASKLITYRIREGLKEIGESFGEQIYRINAVLGQTMVRI